MPDPVREAIRTRYVEQDGRLYARSWQNGVDRIAEGNRLRQELPTRKMGWAAPLARVPDIVREDWRRKGREDLLRGDKRAMDRWLRTSEGRPWSTAPRGRSRPFSKGGI